MIELDLSALRSIGLTQQLHHQALQSAQALAQIQEPFLLSNGQAMALDLQRVTSVHRNRLYVHNGQHSSTAQVWPRLLGRLEAEGQALAVGDWVLVASDPLADVRWVTDRVTPSTHLARRDAEGRRHAVVSNADTALLVMGLDSDFNPRRLERYLALVQGSGILPVVVLTKADLLAAHPERLAEMLQRLHSRLPAGVDVQVVDATQPPAAQQLAPYLVGGQTLVLLGSSGAGKSTLTNTLAGQALQRTGATRQHDGRGQHTTTTRSLHRLACGACVIDTPGLRALQPDVDPVQVAASFGDIAQLAAGCRFRNCRHQGEPGCVVQAELAPDRLRNYHKLLREAQRDQLTPLERRARLAEWKARGRAGAARAREKRGDN